MKPQNRQIKMAMSRNFDIEELCPNEGTKTEAIPEASFYREESQCSALSQTSQRRKRFCTSLKPPRRQRKKAYVIIPVDSQE